MSRLAGLFLISAAPLLAACAPGAPTEERQLEIGAIYPFSGSQGPGGRQELGGLRAALAMAKEPAGSGSPAIRLRVIDVRTSEEATAAVDQLVDRYYVPGAYGSAVSEAAGTPADQRHVVYYRALYAETPPRPDLAAAGTP